MSTESAELQTAAILLVDDQPSRLLSYAAILGGLGLDLVSARSGPEALMRLMEREFAVVLLDVSMPGMDGFETAATIHDHPRFERTPIIFVTAVVTVLYAVMNQTLDILLALLLVIGGVIGGQFGANAGQKLKGEQLRLMIAVIVLAVAIRLLVGLLVTPDDLFSISPLVGKW